MNFNLIYLSKYLIKIRINGKKIEIIEMAKMRNKQNFLKQKQKSVLLCFNFEEKFLNLSNNSLKFHI